MIRDLVKIAIDMVREGKLEEANRKSRAAGEEGLLDVAARQLGCNKSLQGSRWLTEEGDSVSRSREKFAISCVKASSTNHG